ncbi:unnamed protein product, partial [Rotaria sordida]
MPTESVTDVVAPLINEASHEKISTSDATGYNNPTTTSPSSVLPNVSSGALEVHDVVVVSCSNDKLSNGDPIAEELITLRNELLTFGKTRSERLAFIKNMKQLILGSNITTDE